MSIQCRIDNDGEVELQERMVGRTGCVGARKIGNIREESSQVCQTNPTTTILQYYDTYRSKHSFTVPTS